MVSTTSSNSKSAAKALENKFLYSQNSKWKKQPTNLNYRIELCKSLLSLEKLELAGDDVVKCGEEVLKHMPKNG